MDNKKYYTNEAGIDYEDLSDLYIEMSDFPDISNKEYLSEVYCEDENQEQVKVIQSDLYNILSESNTEEDSLDNIDYIKSITSNNVPKIIDKDSALSIVSTSDNGFAPKVLNSGQMTSSVDLDSLILIYNEDNTLEWKKLPDTAWMNTSVNYTVTVYRNITTSGNTINFNIDSKYIDTSTSVYNATYPAGTDAVLTANVNSDEEYTFLGWYDMDGNILESTEKNTYIISGNTLTIKNISDNITIEARYKPADYIISFSKIENGSVFLNGNKYVSSTSFEKGSEVVFTSSSNDSDLYYFNHWVINDVEKTSEKVTISNIKSSYKNCQLIYTEYSRIYVTFDNKHKSVYISVNDGEKSKINSGDKTVCKPGDTVTITSEMVSDNYVSSYDRFTAISGETFINLEAKEKSYKEITFGWNENFINFITINQGGNSYTPSNGETLSLEDSNFSIVTDKKEYSYILNYSDKFSSEKTEYYIDAAWETVTVDVIKNSNSALYISNINYIDKDNNTIDQVFTESERSIDVKRNSNINITCTKQGDINYSKFLHNYLVVNGTEDTNYDLTDTSFSYSLENRNITLSVNKTYCVITYMTSSDNGYLEVSGYSKKVYTTPTTISDALVGDSYVFTASPSGGYKITGWKINESYIYNSNNTLYTDNTYTLTVSGNHTIISDFGSVGYLSVTVRSSNPSYGKINVIDSNGNTESDSEEWTNSKFNYGDQLTISVGDIVSGHKFSGWTLNGNSYSTNSNIVVTITENSIFEAVFELEKILITINSEYSTSSIPDLDLFYSNDDSINTGISYHNLTVEKFNKYFTLDGYIFSGCFTSKNGEGDRIVNSDRSWNIESFDELDLKESSNTKNYNLYVNLYSYWVDASTSTITLDYNGGKNSSESSQETITYSDSTVSLDSPSGTPSKTGYTFTGNYSTEEGSSGETVYSSESGWKDGLLDFLKNSTSDSDKNPTYYAQYKINSHKLTWDPSEGKIDSDQSTYQQGDIDYGTIINTFPSIVTKTGYTLDRWEADTSSGSTIVTKDSGFTMPDEDVTIKAYWNTNVLTINRLSGVTDGSVTPSTLSPITINYSKSKLVPNDFKKKYTVTCYSINPEDSSDKTTYGTLEAPFTFSNWYYENGNMHYSDTDLIDSSNFIGSSNSTIDFVATWNSDGKCSLSTVSYYDNYELVGWSESEGSSSTVSNPYYPEKNNIPLYSVYKGVPCTLSYIIYGSNWNDPEAQEEQEKLSDITSYRYGDEIGENALSVIPSRTGHDFNGWYTAVYGGNKVTSDMLINSLSGNNYIYNIYSQWTESQTSEKTNTYFTIVTTAGCSNTLTGDGVSITDSVKFKRSISGNSSENTYGQIIAVSANTGYYLDTISSEKGTVNIVDSNGSTLLANGPTQIKGTSSITSGYVKSYWSAGGTESSPTVITITTGKITSYIITWNVGDGTWNNETKTKESVYDTIYVTNPIISRPNPSPIRSNYTFTGWVVAGTTSPVYTESQFDNGKVTITDFRKDITFNPIWTLCNGDFTIEFTSDFHGYMVIDGNVVGNTSDGYIEANTYTYNKITGHRITSTKPITIKLYDQRSDNTSEPIYANMYWNNMWKLDSNGNYIQGPSSSNENISLTGTIESLIPYDGTNWYDNGWITIEPLNQNS